MKADWKSKLTSRKLWAAIVGFITPLIIARGGSAELVMEVAALIMSGASLIAYIFCQGMVDAKKEEYGAAYAFELEEVEECDEDDAK